MRSRAPERFVRARRKLEGPERALCSLFGDHAPVPGAVTFTPADN
jgi:hypothetical protein